jgi:hypothetical protein
MGAYDNHKNNARGVIKENVDIANRILHPASCSMVNLPL